MGSPDYPGEENNSFQLPLGQSLPMHGIHNSDDEADSDDSMPVEFQQQNNPDDPYHAYQPLSFEPAAAADDDSSSGDDDSDDENNAEVDMQASSSETIIENTAEREILREIWNAPRPAELDIELDTNKAEEIKSVMSAVSLGLSAIKPPDWAVNVPESKWIEELLQEVRRKSPANNINTNKSDT